LDRLKDELLSTISHELRTPLTVIHGYSQRLAARARHLSPERVEASARAIAASSAQLTRLVGDLLDFERMQRGEVQVEVAEFDLAAALRNLLQELRQRAGGERLEGQIPPLLLVHGDRERARQIVTNLVENALKYALEGPIVLRATRRENLSGAGRVVRVEVIDHGPGIPQREQARVWEKFFRGSDVAGFNRVPGSGIGLAVVKALVEAQAGRVGLESTPGQGATFWFELPAVD
jgi:signal transduction histidine kinase